MTKSLLLKKQNRIFFRSVVRGMKRFWLPRPMHLRPGYDWFYPYYRDRALTLELGLTPYEQLLAAVAGRDDRLSGGRQMPSHWGAPRLNMVSRSSCTGMQFLQAVGTAEAGYRYSVIGEIEDRASHFKADEVVYVSAGDGATSEGEFWESLNTASNLQAAGLLSDRGQWLRDLDAGRGSDGWREHLEAAPDLSGTLRWPSATGPILSTAITPSSGSFRHIREQRGPALLHAHVTRPYSAFPVR
jgi:2-oxoisovalerate dehydrogenase E1 component